ncbi:beta-mannosidase [Verticillium dahliae]|nr:beta-mannosidase [Verticillium dahliae]
MFRRSTSSPSMLRSRQNLRSGWSFKQHDDDDPGAWLPVETVPSQVHIDLLANKRIPDPFVDINEQSVQWVAEKSWQYKLRLPAPAIHCPDNTSTDLVFEGLDTFATVTLNGCEILKSENMHISNRVNVNKTWNSDSENVLEILFDSALLRGRDIVKQHGEHQFFARQTEEGRIPVRKAQYNWGWDWGPILMTAGPWRPVYFEQYTARLDDVRAVYDLAADLKSCSGRLMARVSGASEQTDHLVFLLSRNDKVVFKQTCGVGAGGLVEAAFQIEDPCLWYPAGYGAQSRYQLSAEVWRGQTKLDSSTKLIGFRRCELVQEKDAYGKSFYFRINGVDIFAGGSCWIPGDSFLSQMTAKRYHDWMKLMVESNQIMIRVWGGGIYEDNAFLDACDELGILVWQDFAFACGNYPVYTPFLESIEEEARQNLRRFRSHPSVVVWAGNNEDYQVQERYKLEYFADDKDPESWLESTFPARYIYEFLLPKVVQEEDPSVLYHPGSPWGDGKHTTDPTVGDIHQWNIWHGLMNRYQEAEHLTGRFVSEFGMEAYPHLQTTRRMVTSPREQRPGSLTMDYRNKAVDHERRMMTYVAENFQVRYDLPAFTHLTQITQAETMRYAYKAWRRMWGHPGARKCGGVLVWQLNDCWPTMSWAVVDYYLVKKPAFYAIARALRPLDVGISRSCPEWTSGHAAPSLRKECEYDVWIASSRLDAAQVELRVRFISIQTGKDIRDAIASILYAQPNGTTEVHKKQRVTVATSAANTADDPFVIHASLALNGELVATDTAWPEPLKYLDLNDRHVGLEIYQSRGKISISSRLPIKGLVLEETEGMKLSDNGFDLVPGEKREIQIEAAPTTDHLRWTYLGAPDETSTYRPKL